MITASVQGFQDAAFQKMTAAGPVANPSAVLIALENNIDPIGLRRLAEGVAADRDLAPELIKRYQVTLASGVKALTGIDNNSATLDDILIDSVPDFDVTITGATITTTDPAQYLPNRTALYNPPTAPDFVYYTIDNVREMTFTVSDGNGGANLVSGAPVATFRGVRIPLIAEVTNRRLQAMFVDILIQTVTEQMQGKAA